MVPYLGHIEGGWRVCVGSMYMCICIYTHKCCSDCLLGGVRFGGGGRSIALHTQMHTSAVRFVYGLGAGRQRRHYYEGLHGK